MTGDTVHNSPFGLMYYAKPDMASQNDTRNSVALISWTNGLPKIDTQNDATNGIEL